VAGRKPDAGRKAKGANMVKPRRIHFQLVVDAPDAPGSAKDRRYYAACAPHLRVTAYHGHRLSPHPMLVTCTNCRAILDRVRADLAEEGRP